MKRKLVLFSSVILCLINYGCSKEYKTGDEVVKKVNEVFSNINSINYSLVIKDKYGNEFKSNNLQERTEFDKNNGFQYSKQKAIIEIKDESLKSSTFSFSYDGNTLFVQKKENGEITVLDTPSMQSVMGLLGNALFIYRRPMLLKDKFVKYDSASLLKMETKNEQNCYKILVERSISMPFSDEKEILKTTWWINSKTFYPVASESDKKKTSITIKQVNQTIPNEDFRLIKNNINYKSNKEIENLGLLNMGEKFPVWYLKDASGNLKLSSEFKGKIVVIDFWGTWCPPCKKAMPDIQKLHKKYKNKDVVVIGISVNDKPNAAEEYFKSKGYTYLHLPYGEELSKQIKVKMFPTLYIIDKKGTIIHAEKGYNENGFNEWSNVIDKELEV